LCCPKATEEASRGFLNTVATTLPQALVQLTLPTNGNRGSLMRDIRGDLEERAHIVQEQVRAAHAHFERMAQQLQSERDARIADLKGSLAMIEKLIQFETGIMGNVVPLENAPTSHASLADRMKAVNG
jgi:hypothetical protein